MEAGSYASNRRLNPILSCFRSTEDSENDTVFRIWGMVGRAKWKKSRESGKVFPVLWQYRWPGHKASGPWTPEGHQLRVSLSPQPTQPYCSVTGVQSESQPVGSLGLGAFCCCPWPGGQCWYRSVFTSAVARLSSPEQIFAETPELIR